MSVTTDATVSALVGAVLVTMLNRSLAMVMSKDGRLMLRSIKTSVIVPEK
jgi:hypothetical protein